MNTCIDNMQHRQHSCDFNNIIWLVLQLLIQTELSTTLPTFKVTREDDNI